MSVILVTNESSFYTFQLAQWSLYRFHCSDPVSEMFSLSFWCHTLRKSKSKLPSFCHPPTSKPYCQTEVTCMLSSPLLSWTFINACSFQYMPMCVCFIFLTWSNQLQTGQHLKSVMLTFNFLLYFKQQYSQYNSCIGMYVPKLRTVWNNFAFIWDCLMLNIIFAVARSCDVFYIYCIGEVMVVFSVGFMFLMSLIYLQWWLSFYVFFFILVTSYSCMTLSFLYFSLYYFIFVEVADVVCFLKSACEFILWMRNVRF